MFRLLWEAIIGLIVGALAKFIMPGKDPGGIDLYRKPRGVIPGRPARRLLHVAGGRYHPAGYLPLNQGIKGMTAKT